MASNLDPNAGPDSGLNENPEVDLENAAGLEVDPAGVNANDTNDEASGFTIIFLHTMLYEAIKYSTIYQLSKFNECR